MAKYLLDTHVLLWWLAEPGRLSPEATRVIVNESSVLHFSAAAAWEMAIKKTLGRIDYPGNLPEVLTENRIEPLPVTLADALAVADLPLHHRDPFDRIQIAQAKLGGLAMVTRDHEFERYGVAVVLA
ncbi:MAG TPA: type II toxin-antitoxin system VapC family toxin [Phycisphaerales bacterium]|nr:type II toxin-antitoxin system VapC family toxin [Phycisphaerales bacterium]